MFIFYVQKSDKIRRGTRRIRHTDTSKYTGSQNSTNRTKCKFRTVRIMQAADEKYATAGGVLCCVRAYERDGMLLKVYYLYLCMYFLFLLILYCSMSSAYSRKNECNNVNRRRWQHSESVFMGFAYHMRLYNITRISISPSQWVLIASYTARLILASKESHFPQ